MCAAVALLAFTLVMLPDLMRAERLPVRVYSTADGLPSNQINCVKRDSRGFLWFCTAEGLSRFDGYTFTNYGIDHGLPDRVVTDFLETRSGEYWVATSRGLARFNPKPGPKAPMFTVYRPDEAGPAPQVNALLEDHQGVIWVGTNGVFQLVQTGGQWTLHRADLKLLSGDVAENFLEDHEGNLWVAFYTGGGARLCRRSPSGRLDTFQDDFLRGRNRILAMLEDRLERIWLGTYHGLALLAPHPQVGGRLIERVYGKRDGLTEVPRLFQSSDGRLWVSGDSSVLLVRSDASVKRIRFEAYGAGDRRFDGVEAEDRDGNLWNGRVRLARNGLVSYGRADGLADENIRGIFEGSDGALYVVTGFHNRLIHRFDGKRFLAVAPKAPGHDASWDWQGWGWGQIHLQAHTGEWWVATGNGLFRYPPVKRLEDLAHTSPKAVYTAKKGLGADEIFRLYEDSRGDLWIGAWGAGPPGLGLVRWERSSERFHVFTPSDGWTANGGPTAFREDRSGNVWIGLWGGGLARYCRSAGAVATAFRKGSAGVGASRSPRRESAQPAEGHFTFLTTADGFPEGTVFSIFLDHAGRLWAGTTRGGLVRIDDPSAKHPRFVNYTTKQELSSNDVRAITEDHWGRIYFWTGRGVDRLQPQTGAIRHYTEADGLVPAGSDHNVAFCDRHGTLWFGLEGLSRLDPEPNRPDAPSPPIRITKVRVRGVDYPVSELGETDLSGLTLQPDQNEIQIEFASLNFGTGNVIKYQYKLEGAESDWSAPSELRAVNYPRLSPGAYRLLVRTVNSDGLMSAAPAVVSFRLLPPVWRRWWFLTFVVLLAASLVYWAYRYRLERLLEMERVRTRIATDLHDDIGSSLTQIAIMSEVARRDVVDPRAAEPLERIADLSRELVDSMSDIVWAINPKRDHLSDLAQRMRRFASDVLTVANVEIAFHVPAELAGAPLGADVRREVFLVFKESINNVTRHSHCKHVEVLLNLQGPQLLMRVRDDGQGFVRGQPGDGQGHGLDSIEARARRLGGNLEVSSEPGRGTTVTLTVPFGRHA